MQELPPSYADRVSLGMEDDDEESRYPWTLIGLIVGIAVCGLGWWGFFWTVGLV